MNAPQDQQPTLRRDARRNREKLVEAARAVFAEQGLGASLNEIARRAGVGNVTLYRHFPTREALAEAAVAQTAAEISHFVEESLTAEDAWGALVTYVEQLCDLVATDRGINDLMVIGVPASPSLEAIRDRNREMIRVLVRRAKAQGRLRADVAAEDFMFIMATLSRTVPASEAVAPGTWRRHLSILLDAFRTGERRTPPGTPLDADQLTRAVKGVGFAK